MVVVDNAAVGADGHIYAGLPEVFVPGCCHFNQGGGLTTADALGLTGDADGAAADAHLYKVCTGFCQEAEAVPVNHVAGANLHLVAVSGAYPVDGLFLPAGVALGGVDDEHIRTGFQQSGNALGIVPGVDACAHQIPLLLVQQLQGVALVGGIVLAEDKVQQVVIFVYDGEAIQLVFPDNIVGFLQGGLRGGGDQLFPGSHEGGNLVRGLHAAHPVVPAGDDAEKLSVGGAVGGNGHGGEAILGLQCQNVCQGVLRGQIGSGGDKSGLVVLYLGNHRRLVFNGLGTKDEADAALFGQGNGKGVVGHGLHDRRGQGHIQGNGRFFHALAVFHQGRFQGHMIGDAVLGCVARNEQILAEGVTRFLVIICHEKILLIKMTG